VIPIDDVRRPPASKRITLFGYRLRRTGSGVVAVLMLGSCDDDAHLTLALLMVGSFGEVSVSWVGNKSTVQKRN
jgi:hypothetical protein